MVYHDLVIVKTSTQKTHWPSELLMCIWDFHLKMEAALSSFSLGTILLFSFVPFSIACLFFGTQGGYYNTDKYEGDGTAHKVLK